MFGQKKKRRAGSKRRGAATLDYLLVLAVIFPLAAFLMMIVPQIVHLVYEMLVIQIGSPLM
jgi:hypothetical protein